ncbi:hypothetical protein BDN72DRAFT_865154 [Pluteus cervinus]|uniref:Uncharacterized protein n=1 Tax=Pluteus cervinus TaxID=181527 RepID=A0ACD3A3L6_9AGAR|nr:hypothetical protein BDN72DRAFT_865154 [Pluteus cervinus]
MFISDGAKLVRDALAKEKAPAITFIDKLNAIGPNDKRMKNSLFATPDPPLFASDLGLVFNSSCSRTPMTSSNSALRPHCQIVAIDAKSSLGDFESSTAELELDGISLKDNHSTPIVHRAATTKEERMGTSGFDFDGTRKAMAMIRSFNIVKSRNDHHEDEDGLEYASFFVEDKSDCTRKGDNYNRFNKCEGPLYYGSKEEYESRKECTRPVDVDEPKLSEFMFSPSASKTKRAPFPLDSTRKRWTECLLRRERDAVVTSPNIVRIHNSSSTDSQLLEESQQTHLNESRGDMSDLAWRLLRAFAEHFGPITLAKGRVFSATKSPNPKLTNAYLSRILVLQNPPYLFAQDATLTAHARDGYRRFFDQLALQQNIRYATSRSHPFTIHLCKRKALCGCDVLISPNMLAQSVRTSHILRVFKRHEEVNLSQGSPLIRHDLIATGKLNASL